VQFTCNLPHFPSSRASNIVNCGGLWVQWVAGQYAEYLLLLGRELGLGSLHGVPLRSS